MAITVKHKFVSAIPDAGDPTIVQPSNWNDTHELTGLGTMAEQNAIAVAITGGTISGVAVTGYVPTTETITAGTGLTGGGDLSANRTIALANTAVTTGTYGNAARTITQTVDQQGRLTNIFDQPIAIANTQVSGLGTASTKDAGVANGVASLDCSGTVPISQLPAGVLGALSYQVTWNASTNTPTLTSSVGTKGYYYVVDVAGSTNLNGITDWKVGDWAVFNGSIWQKIDNTDAVTSVNGYTGTVVLTNTDISGFGTMSTQNANSVAITGGAIDGTTIGATTTSTGKFTTLNASTSLTTPIVQASNSGGLSLKNSAGTTQISMGGGGGDNVSINVATNINGTNAQIDISPTGTGHVHMKPTGTGSIEIAPTNVGTIDNMTIGATTPKAITGTTITATTFSGSGASLTSIPNSALVNSAITINGVSTALGGSASVGTVTSVAATAGTGISVSGSPITGSGTLTITNTAPDQTVALTSGTGISVTGTYPNFTVTNTAPSSGGTVTSVSGTTGRITSTGGTTPVIDLASGIATAGTTGSSTLIPVVTIDTYGRVTGITTASNPQGTVTSVTGTAPIVSSGGATPAISMAAATTSVNGYLTSTDWNTFNGKAPAVTYTTNYVPYGQGTTTPNQSSSFTFDGTALTAPRVNATVSVAASGTQGAINYGTLSYSDTNHLATFQTSVNSYSQVEIQNTNAGASASADMIVGNNNTTATTYYGDFGMNSGGWAGTGAFNSPNNVYLTATSGDLAIGTTTSNQIRFAVNGGTTDALTIATTGAVTTPNQLTGSTVRASNGIVVNSKSIAASYSIASGDNAMSVGPVTVASGQAVTVASGSRWVVL